MPLSENEQNILQEIEKHLQESDPRLAREVSKTTVYSHALGSVRWNVLGFFVGLSAMVGTLQVHFLLAFLGFLIMLVSALALERNLRLMGKAGVDQLTTAFRAANPNLRGRASQDDEETDA